MVRINVITSKWDLAEHRYARHVVAGLEVRGHDYQITGDPRYVSLDIPVLDVETGERLIFSDDPERWAQLLPTAYRAGDVTVELAEVTMPVTQTHGVHAH